MRVVWVLVSSLSCAVIALLSALWGVGSRAAPSMDAATWAARVALTSDESAARRLLSWSCARDVHVERLLLELAAGATAANAAHEQQTLARALGGQVDLVLSRGPALEPLTSAAEVDLTLLRRALAGRVSAQSPERPEQLIFFDACVREQGALKLWLLRRTSLASTLREAGIDAQAFVIAQASAVEAEIGTVARFPTLGAATLEVRSKVGARASEPLTPLVWTSVCGALIGALLGFALTRPRPVDDAVLATLEQAAERVAQGDLSSQIGLRVGGRADQTFRTFDRMTVELRDMRLKLADAERAAAWQDMAQRIAHEIKNPLSPIRMALETLRKAHEKGLAAFDEIFDESTRAMLEEVARMEHIVREFSEFARLPKARPGALALAQLVQETARLYTPDDVALELSLPPTETLIHADREQLTQVLVNLLANAVHAARTTAAPRIRVRMEQTESETILSVEDNGPGVPDAERERIFEPYVTSKSEGTGLGLAIARRIVHDHAGSIGVDDSALGGACFRLRLPAA